MPGKIVNLPCGQLKRLYFAQLIARQCGYYLLQGLECIVQALGALSLPHIGHDPLVAELVRFLRFARLAFQAASRLAKRLAGCIASIQQAAIVAQARGRHVLQFILLGIAAHGAERRLARIFHVISIGAGVGAAVQTIRWFIGFIILAAKRIRTV